MSKKNFWSSRIVRAVASVSLATLFLSQLPVGSLLGTPALGQGAPRYTDTEEDDSGDFLGINGLSNRDVIQFGVIGLVAYGIVAAVRGGAGNAGAASAGSPTNTTPASTGTLPDPVTSGDESKPIWDTLHDDSQKRFVQFTQVTETNEVKENPLRDSQNAPYTAFAPTDTALSALPAADLAKLSDPMAKSENQKVLLKHVVLGKYSVRDLEKLDGGFPLATASGDTLTITKNPDGTVNVNGVPVEREDIKASNGVSHPVPSTVK